METQQLETQHEPIELVYEFTDEDVRTYYEDYASYYQHIPSIRRRQWHFYAAFYTALVAVPGLCFVAMVWLWNDLRCFVGLIVCSALWSRILTRKWHNWTLRKLNKFPGLVGKHQTRISAEGLSDRNGVMAWTMFWSQIMDVSVGKRHILFLVRGQDQPSVIPVPLHVFAGDQDVKSFVERFSHFWQTSAALEPRE